jgi:hypothetical protein
MADYYLILDASQFEGSIRPALAASWRQRSFGPCRALCANLVRSAQDYQERYHTGAGQPFLCQVTDGLPFDRTLWRSLVGEVLLFAAVEIPEFQVNAEALWCLLAPDSYRAGSSQREDFVPIQQVHHGARDLQFGGAVYRPEQAGWNNRDDVARLADYLATIRPDAWTCADLKDMRDLPEEDRADELAFTQEWFPVLRELYERTRDLKRVMVIESIY